MPLPRGSRIERSAKALWLTRRLHRHLLLPLPSFYWFVLVFFFFSSWARPKITPRGPPGDPNDAGAAWEDVFNHSTYVPAVFCAIDTLPRRLLHCMLLHFPDQRNSPGDRVWMGWWGYAKRQEIEDPFVESSGQRSSCEEGFWGSSRTPSKQLIGEQQACILPSPHGQIWIHGSQRRAIFPTARYEITLSSVHLCGIPARSSRGGGASRA